MSSLSFPSLILLNDLCRRGLNNTGARRDAGSGDNRPWFPAAGVKRASGALTGTLPTWMNML
jgi:hypothetical protein